MPSAHCAKHCLNNIDLSRGKAEASLFKRLVLAVLSTTVSGQTELNAADFAETKALAQTGYDDGRSLGGCNPILLSRMLAMPAVFGYG